MILLLSLLLLNGASGAGSGVAPSIDRAVPDPRVSYILLDAHTREVLASRWSDQENAIPVGSLVKPFTALAYGDAFPEFECKGTASRCWLPRGHGRLGFAEALADSCNGYFLNLAKQVSPGALAVVAAKYGIAAPSTDSAETRIGLGAGWRIAPIALARAYAELAARRGEPRVDEILNGLAKAPDHGTAAAIGKGALAKTGTAPCVAEHRDKGDGFTVALDPADAPRVVLLVRVHGVPGAVAANSGARILQTVRTGR